MYQKVIYGNTNGSKEDQGFFGVLGGYQNISGKLMGLMGHSGEREGCHGRWRVPPPCPNRIGQGVGAPPPFLLPLPPFPFPLSVGRKGGAD